MTRRTTARAVLDLLYPPRCVGCGAFRTFLCEACDAAMTPTDVGDRCANCSARWGGGLNCPRCFSCSQLDLLAGAFDMDGPARELVHALKYRGVRDIAPLMAERMAGLPERHQFDVAVPVPLHAARERWRGFNQAALLLGRLAWPEAEGRLVRTRKTDTQVGMRVHERRSNVVGAFQWQGPRLDGRTVALVDDVITTGATVNECAAVLRQHGARRVVAFAFARASYLPGTDAPVQD
jgi:ComF family protein